MSKKKICCFISILCISFITISSSVFGLDSQNSVVWEFDNETEVNKWLGYATGPNAVATITWNQCTVANDNDGTLTFTANANATDPLIMHTLTENEQFEISEYKYYKIRYKTNSSVTTSQILANTGNGFKGTSIYYDLNCDREWHEEVIDVSSSSNYKEKTNATWTTGKLKEFRFDFFDGSGSGGNSIEVDYIGFFTSMEAAQKYGAPQTTTEPTTEPSTTINPSTYDSFNYLFMFILIAFLGMFVLLSLLIKKAVNY